ncbi:SGNH/GDSL hydrolase family protein [Candidatus Thiosymbion oneisti]|uniref:SGNH/GDSL hydrolase family protein n=1 Tax=Candidatus Thiosymbion oneisti TaxID=589554 RepID=UPI00159F0F74|nr:GDSL-type esterase/lipase family protein [Candidatus Thiosymbion oneisti]
MRKIRKMKHTGVEKHPKKMSVIFLAVSLLFSIYGAEILLSLVTPMEKIGTEVRNIRLREHIPSTVKYLVPTDAYMENTDSLVKKEYRFEIDRDGYLYPSRIHDKPDLTIIFLGGSTTECLYVDENNRFPYLVGRLLEENGRKVNSFNSGVSGNNSMHSNNILLNKGIALDPDVAIMMHNVNDLNVLLYEKNYWNENPNKSLMKVYGFSSGIKAITRAALPRLYDKLVVLKMRFLVGDEFTHLRGKQLTINKHEILQQFERSLLNFINISRVHKIMPILMTQASRFKDRPDAVIVNALMPKLNNVGIAYDEFKDLYDEMNDSIRKTGRINKVQVIDLEKEVPQDNAYMYDFAHLNNNGSQYVAELIADRLGNLQ